MNILMINYEYPPLGGGGGVFNKQLAEELSKSNNITVVTSNFNNQKPYEIKNDIELIRVPVLMRTDQNAATIISMLSFSPASLWAGYQLLKRRPFDIVHSMFAIPSAPSALALAKKFHLPHVLSILGGDIYDPSKKLSPHKTPLLHYTVTKMMQESDKVVALSSDVRKRALKYYNVSKEIDVIHLGIPKPLVVKRTRDHFGFKSDDILLITVGRLIARKGLYDLVGTVEAMRSQNIKLVVVGDGPKRVELVELSKSLGISDHVLFFGHVSDETKFQLLDISDIYVSSSHHEGFGIVFLEAMASGLPVVCYDEGGQAEFLLDKKTGFLVSYGNTSLLTRRIRQLCEDTTLR
ncbi:MAG: glycosyltransferase family 4 protein, partial [Proteobacteria bacterium]|nr:glycosyltransferase family 4 protein [Pseudomonadota bacterium]